MLRTPPLVTQIQRFAVNDGPGFRTVVFLKGCALSCRWCHNPETQSFSKDLYWKRRLCVQCGKCRDACPLGAVRPPIPPEEAQREGSTYQKIDRQTCTGCLQCVPACAHGALEIVGRPMTVREILAEVERDRPFYDHSGGGVTVSGGEPAAHPEFVAELLDACRARGLNTCLDTSGHCTWEVLNRLAEKTDLVLYDLKHLDDSVHRELVGVGNAGILENLSCLLAQGKPLWLRILVIPDRTDTPEYHARLLQFLSSLPARPERIDLLAYHNWCEDKYAWLGRNWPMKEQESLDPSLADLVREMYEEEGFVVTVGGSGFETDVPGAA